MKELKILTEKEEGLRVPDNEKFYLMFLRSGLMSPSAGMEVMRNYFMLKKNYSRYFQVNIKKSFEVWKELSSYIDNYTFTFVNYKIVEARS